ncbi:TPA: hypothetical protein ACYSA8_000795 [Escherichia coli]|jgi:hypothetical protein|uniref:hypothetical protein n=1 Tax=Enterobacteriaceae TaxID=543 RepID=UPI0004D945B6|nr:MULTISPECIES: hypothetical protein [Enterobacteriaceae]TAT62235.1 hypothetical protein EGM92_17290 [Enterobacter cloacae]DAM72325.1 MAG TPA: hypothetical protein [Bacteriophage sp.]EEZ3917307.1 hypothetical protein [Escherichia coli]EFA5144220.1 hypothetical protein [Escherichia coli]EFE4975820.1 hypothetical protein [Escherichia coli]
MPVTEHAQRHAARADALVTAQLAFALNGYSFDGLAERHRQTLNREALLRQASTPLQRYCLLNNCEPWECLAAVLNRMKRPDGSRRWKAVRLSDRVFNGRVHPVRKTPDEVYAAIARRLFLPKPVHQEVIQHIRALGLLPVGDNHQ